MTNDEEQEQEQGKPRVIVHWNSTQFSPTIYDLETFKAVKTKPKATGVDAGRSKVFNPTTNQYEAPAKIDFLPPSPSSTKPKRKLV